MTIEQFERINKIRKNRTWTELKEEKMMNGFLESVRRCMGSNLKEEIKMKDLATIDRIEGEFAVCELLDGNMVNISVKQFKERPQEGDIFNIEVISDKGIVKYEVKDKNTTEMESRRKAILEKINRLKNR